MIRFGGSPLSLLGFARGLCPVGSMWISDAWHRTWSFMTSLWTFLFSCLWLLQCRCWIYHWRSASSCWTVRVPQFWLWIWLALSCRIGEATCPGPVASWTISACNPSGLNGKTFAFLDDPADVVLLSETHLTGLGRQGFVGALRAAQSPLTHMITGHPVPTRHTASQVGQWSGVGILSRFPLRSLPHQWDPLTYESSRLCIGAVCCNGLWVHICVEYGTPTGGTQPRAKQVTDHLLFCALDRLTALPGPKILAGDFNHDWDSLEAVRALHALGYKDAQDLHQLRTGTFPQATCKQKTRRDFMFLSHELSPLFRECRVLDHSWTDHAELISVFEGGALSVERFPWPVPDPMDWSVNDTRVPGPSVDFSDPDSMDAAYLNFWSSVEQSNALALKVNGKCCPRASFGRGSRHGPVRRCQPCAPLKAPRIGDKGPAFLGSCVQHVRWTRQFRRLVSFTRLTAVIDPTPAHLTHQQSLWRSILDAPGFPGGFATWWSFKSHALGEPSRLPVLPPSHAFAQLVKVGFEYELSLLEKALNQSRTHAKRVQRAKDSAQFFAHVRRAAPAQVSTLVAEVQNSIAEIDETDFSISFHEPSCGWMRYLLSMRLAPYNLSWSRRTVSGLNLWMVCNKGI